MKKTLFFLFTILIITACNPSDYTISGTVDAKVLNGKKIFIKERINREWIALDSCLIENGKFSFHGTSDSAKIAYLTYEFPAENPVRQAFVLENGKLTTDIDTTGFMVIKGTTQNNLLQSYQDDKKVFYKKSESVYDTSKDHAKTAEQLLNLAKERAMLNMEEIGIDKIFSTEHVNTLIGTHVFTNSFYGMNTSDKESITNLMNPDTKKIVRIQEIISDIDTEKKVAVGNNYTNFSLPMLAGGSMSLSDLVGKSDYLLVDFWASWCGPCIRSLPELKKLYATYNGSRFEILGVSLDDNRAAWSGAVASHQLGWKHVSDLKGWKCAGSRIYAVNSIPNTVLIDKSGKIVGRNLSIPEIENLLQDKGAKN